MRSWSASSNAFTSQFQGLGHSQSLVKTVARECRGCALYGRVAHAPDGLTRSGLRATMPHDDCRRQRSAAGRFGQARFPGQAAQPALGSRFHVRRHLVWLYLHGLRDRRLCPPRHRLARGAVNSARSSSWMRWTGQSGPAGRSRVCDSPFGPRQPISLDSVLRASD